MNQNNKTYIFGGLAFVLSLLLLSTTFVVSEDLDNRMAKIFWFYEIIILTTGACTLLAWFRPFRFTLTDGLVLLYAGYTLLNFYHSDSRTTTRAELFVLVTGSYFLFRRLITLASPHYVNAALLLAGGIEAVWGLAQLYGFTPSQHNHFDLTGSFFNPGPYSGFLVAILPLALHYTLTTKKAFQIASSLILILLIIVLPATMSRGAWLAAIAGCSLVMGYHYHLGQHLAILYKKHPITCSLSSIGFTLIIITLLTSAYLLKKDSADGRVLIWKVSSTIISQHPLTGVGFGNFAGPYGEAQAAYFSTGKASSQEEMVADIPEFAFNEFVQITTETGIIGLLLFLRIIFSVLRNVLRSRVREQAGWIGSLIALLVFSCFSYPFSILPLLIVFTLLLAQSNLSAFPPSPRWFTGIFYLLLLLPVYFLASDKKIQENAYKRWKNNQFLFNMQLYERTLNDYRELYPLLKEQSTFLFEYGQCLSKTDQPEESNRILQEAAHLSADPMIQNIMGKNYQAQQQYPEAEKAYLQASSMVPNRLYPLYLLAKMYKEKGDIEKAIATAHLVLQKNPKVSSLATKEIKREMKLLIKGL